MSIVLFAIVMVKNCKLSATNTRNGLRISIVSSVATLPEMVMMEMFVAFRKRKKYNFLSSMFV